MLKPSSKAQQIASNRRNNGDVDPNQKERPRRMISRMQPQRIVIVRALFVMIAVLIGLSFYIPGLQRFLKIAYRQDGDDDNALSINLNKGSSLRSVPDELQESDNNSHDGASTENQKATAASKKVVHSGTVKNPVDVDTLSSTTLDSLTDKKLESPSKADDDSGKLKAPHSLPGTNRREKKQKNVGKDPAVTTDKSPENGVNGEEATVMVPSPVRLQPMETDALQNATTEDDSKAVMSTTAGAAVTATTSSEKTETFPKKNDTRTDVKTGSQPSPALKKNTTDRNYTTVREQIPALPKKPSEKKKASNPLRGNLARPGYTSPNAADFNEYWRASHQRSYPSRSLHVSSKQELPPKRQNPATMIIGIFTSLRSKDRRQVIRETALSFHLDMQGYEDESASYPRVCSLHDLRTQKLEWKDCLIAYTFVSESGIGSLSKLALEVNSSVAFSPKEKDMIFVNIPGGDQEAKTRAWFQYASTNLVDEMGLVFDYVAKMDDDVLLFTGNWIDVLERGLLPKPGNISNQSLVYGGRVNSIVNASWTKECDEGNADYFSKCPLVGPLWMSGQFYFLSRQMAEFSTSDMLDHKALAASPEEAVSMASYIWSHPGNVSVAEIPSNSILVTYSTTDDGEPRTAQDRFQGVLFAHSVDSCDVPYGPYYQGNGNARKVWREYVAFRWNKRDDFSNRYILDDHPAFNNGDPRNVTVHPSDYIYSSGDPEASPIVLKAPYNLVFFPIPGVADVVWRCLIRRLLGYKDWDNPIFQYEGLPYLSDFSLDEASIIMSSPNYTRAMFIRNPLDRIQANYVLMGARDKHHEMIQGCNCTRNCGEETNVKLRCMPYMSSFRAFLNHFVPYCDKPYWRPQTQRMEPKYFRVLDFVGHYETFGRDAVDLLHQALGKELARSIEWINVEEFQKVYEKIDLSYSTTKVRRRFGKFWQKAFDGQYKIDIESELLSNYSIQLPRKMNGKKKKRQNQKRKTDG